jgi:GGDEF domain-containing protein
MGMNTELIGGVLSRFCELDTIEFRGMCAEDEWANVLGKRLRTIGGQE